MTSSLPSEPTPGKDAVSPWQETVRLSPVPPGPRPNSEPSIPDEVVSAPVTARFGKFVRTRRLGAGGMGEVWKAWDTVLGRWVALKFLKGGDDDEIARFQREAQTAGRLHHPNIAAIYEVNEDQGRRYIAMQFVDGQNFHDFPRKDRRLLVSLIVDAARGLQYAHEQGVIHRDLKPENLMVTTRGEERHVFLMDFGLARAAEGASKLSATGYLLGTPMYMSPEQARGEKVEVSSDVYSLGLTLYELLTDRNPFASENVYETLRRVQELDPPAPREIDRKVDEDLETIVLKAISKDPASRYASAKIFGDDLQAYLAGEPIQGRRESLSKQIIRRVRRHPMAFAAGAVLIVGLATSGLIARSALRDRRYTDLTGKLDEGLRVREWTPEHLRALERLIDDLAQLAPAQAAELRNRLPKALAESIRASDLVRARTQLALLDQLDPAEASRLGSELRQRETQWPPVFKLERPFGEVRDVFERGKADVTGDSLRSASAGLVRTLKTCEGNVELKAEFEGPWKESALLGLVFNPGDPSGYQFLLTTPEDVPPPSFASVRAAKGSFRLQIRRGEALLREEMFPAALIDTEGALRLMARREDDLLKVQANDLPLVEFQDPFSLRSGPKGVFAVEWPAGVGIRRLLATRQALPMKPSPLDVGDSLFLQKKYDEAIDRYGEAAQSVNAGSSRIEALYKQGLCNLQLNREDEARKIFEGVAAGFITAPQSADKRWYFLADCQLLVLHFRDQDGIERATGILDKLKEYQYSFDRLALLMPPDVRRQVLHSAQIGSVGGNFHRRPEDHVARIEFAVRASELLESPAQRGEWVYQGLMRAYMMVGRNLDAIRIAERSFRTFRFGGEALDDYCWIRRLTGDEKEIRQALDALDRTLPGDPQRLIERCRLHVALKAWDAALADVDGYLAKPEDYHTFSAACLIRGFLLERRGAPPEVVEEAWRKGLLKNWRSPKSDPSVPGYDPARGLLGMPMLHNWIMASLCSDMSDVDAEQMLSGLMAFAGKDNPVFNKLMRPSILRATWRTPRARDVARHVAFRDVPFSDVARFPLFVGWIAFVHEVCFKSSDPLSPEQDELLWRMSGEIYTAYRDGALTDRYFLPFGVIVSGNPNAPGMGWTEVAKLLEPNPKVRGPLGYVFGQRYLKKGDPTTALLFFRSALADADREPPQPILKRLAQVEIDALSGRK